MTTSIDYRNLQFSIDNINSSGRYLGRSAYWRLFSIEKLIRILINSVLLAQIGPTWWDKSTDKKLNDKIISIRADYAQQPHRSSPEKHNLYYVYLTELNRILRENNHLFIPIIPDINNVIVRLEQIRLPRNMIGHMN